MIRYLRQRDCYSCGPIAIMNALKWAGESVTYKDLKYYQELCRVEPPVGTTESDITNCLRKQKRLKVSKIKAHVTLDMIDKYLAKGSIVLLIVSRTVYKRMEEHLVLIESKQRDRFSVVNIYKSKKTVLNIERKTLKKLLKESRKYRSDGNPHAWFISKRS